MKHPSMKWFLEKAQSIIIQNLAKILQKCVKKFIFSTFACLQAYSWWLYYEMNSFTVIFQQHFQPQLWSPMYWLKPLPHQILKSLPSMFSTPVRNPGAVRDRYIKFKSNQLKKFSSSKNIKIKDFLICKIS